MKATYKSPTSSYPNGYYLGKPRALKLRVSHEGTRICSDVGLDSACSHETFLDEHGRVAGSIGSASWSAQM